MDKVLVTYDKGGKSNISVTTAQKPNFVIVIYSKKISFNYKLKKLMNVCKICVQWFYA